MPIKRELTQKESFRRVESRKIAMRDQNCDRDRKVKVRSAFAEVRWRKVDRDLGPWEREIRMFQCTPHTFPRFLYRRVRQTDYAFLTSPQARETIDHEGITVLDYRPLQQVWND
jgi:hypothetical protein